MSAKKNKDAGPVQRPAEPTLSDAPSPEMPRKKGKWWRRFKWLLLILVVGGVLLRIALGFALPLVVSGVASTLGMNAQYDHMSLSLTGGEARVWNLRVIPKDPAVSGGEPVFTANYLRGDISPLALLQGRLVVWRAEADTLELRLERRADGSMPLLDLVLASLPAREPDPEPVPLSFTAPLAVDALRLNRVRAHIKDDAVQPPLDTTIDLNVHVSKVGPDAPPTEVEIDIFAPGLLDVLKIRALATARERELDSSFNVELFGLRPGALAGYLASLGLRPAAEEIGARMTGTLTTTAVAGDDRAIDTLLVLENIVCTEDGAPDLKVQQVRLEAPYVGPAGVDAREVLIEGVRFAARRTEEGVIHVPGAEFGAPRRGAGAARVLTSEDKPAEPDVDGPSPATMLAPMSFKLAQFTVRDLSMTVTDQAIAPPARVTADLLGFSVRDLAWPPTGEDAVLPFEATLAAPGIARSARASGEVRPYGDVLHLATTLAAEGIVPAAVEPYLRALGIEALLKEGYFSAQVEGSLDMTTGDRPRLSARLRDISFTEGAPEGGQALALMSEVNVGGLALDADGTLRVDELTLRGPALDVRFETDGAITAAGFRRLPAIASPNAEGDEFGERPALRQGAVAALVKAIDLGRVTWEEIDLTVTDATVDPPIVMSIADAGVLVSALRIDLVPPATGADASRAGTVALRLAAPDLIERLDASGTLAASAGTLDANIDFKGEGMTLASLRPLLARRGIEVQWEGASIAGSVAARSAPEAGARLPRLDVELKNLTLTDGQNELAGVDALAIKQFIAAGDGSTRLEAFEAARPRLRGSRAADGSITLAGLHFAVPADAPAAPETRALVAQAPDGAADTPPPVFPFAPLVLPPVAVGGVRVTGAELAWKDEMRADAQEVTLWADFEVGRFDTIDPAAGDTPFNAVLHGPGLDSLRVAGNLGLRPDEQHINAEIFADGVDGAAMAALLPPGVELAVSDGSLRLTAQTQLRPAIAEGGLAAQLAVSNFEWRDGAAAEPLAAMESLTVDVARYDPAGGAIDVSQVSVTGLAGGAVLGADGSTTISGIRLPPEAPVAPEPEPQLAAAAVPSTGRAQEKIADVQQDAAADAQKVRTALEEATKASLPRVTVQNLGLHLARFSVTNELHPEAAPLVLQHFRLSNAQPIVLDSAADEAGDPTELTMSGAISPIVGAFQADLKSQPFARQPTLNLALRAQGLRGDGLLELRPELAQTIDGSELTDGHFSLDLEGRFDVQRRGGIPDLASGIGGEVLVKNITFRNGADGPVLLGLDELEADRIRIEPNTGGLIIGTMDLRTPRAQVALDNRGIHAAGLVFLTGKEAAAQPRGDEAPAELAQAAQEPAAAAATTTAALPPEIRIDTLRISGVDFVFEDRTFDPPLVAPINSLDVDVRGLSNRLATEPRMLRFSILANSGKIELPKPPEQSGIAGAVGDIVGSPSQDTPGETELRDLFAQFSTNGRLQLHPAPNGRMTLSLTGLELLCLRGLAQTQDITIGNGVLDLNADAKLNPDNTIDLRTKSALTSLRVSEPADGPVYRYLRLPAPLDVVIVTLQDAGGTITLPVDLTVEQGQVGGGRLVGELAGALSQVIATAIVQSPSKVASGAITLIGVPRGEQGSVKRNILLSFEPGSTQLDAPSRSRLAAARDLMKQQGQAKASVKHRLGAQDVPLLTRRANPSPQEALAVASRLRAQRDQLLDDRAQLVGYARSAVAFGTPDEASAASDALRTADARTAQLDQAIDSALEMLNPGAPRRADRRTRTTAISLGDQRLAVVQEALAAGDRAQKANAQFDPPSGAQAEDEPQRPAGGVIEIEIVYPRRGRDILPYIPFI